jgi:3-dehydrotetronate 4-kinase
MGSGQNGAHLWAHASATMSAAEQLSASVLKLGCIADDFTGATDLSNNLVRAGMRVTQLFGVPNAEINNQADATVIALKTRTVAVEEAVAQSLAACRWLRAAGAAQIYFKYCSTFDSTPRGNIGPVIDALLRELGADFTIATPSFPENGRSVYMGNLFVGMQLLSESSMRDHPLTPMTDSNLVRVLQAQSRSKVGLLPHITVNAGDLAVHAYMSRLRAEGINVAIADAISNQDLMTLGRAVKGLALVTGGSGLAIGLPQNWDLGPRDAADKLPRASGHQAVISGSCSQATNVQVADWLSHKLPAFAIDATRLDSGAAVIDEAMNWALQHVGKNPILIYSTAEPVEVRRIQQQLGSARAGEMLEQALAEISARLIAVGVRQLIVAGGETSGACVTRLGVQMMTIGAQIDPGVPWCYANSEMGPLHLALKSGNFGGVDFFTRAFELLP